MFLNFRNKKKFILLFSITILWCFSLFKSNIVHSETFGNVPVTYTMTKSLAYPLNVDVTGDGEVLNGNDTFRNQKKHYLLASDETITFELKASEKSEIKSVKLDGKDVINKLKDNRIIIEGTNNEQNLSIIFDEKKDDSIFPKTGDSRRIGLYIILLIISFGICSCMYYRDKKQQ